MNLQKQIVRVLCGAGLVFALAVMPATWALSPSAGAGQAASATRRSHADKLDINAATEEQLSALPGVGDGYAKRIIAGRPYRGKNQLVSKGILPQAVYEKIKDQIIAHRVKK
ncbi:MAG: ComEA family DNA-binding protein [Acidobacteriaceae bacterium]